MGATRPLPRQVEINLYRRAKVRGERERVKKNECGFCNEMPEVGRWSYLQGNFSKLLLRQVEINLYRRAKVRGERERVKKNEYGFCNEMPEVGRWSYL